MTPLNDAATSTALATIYGLFIRSRTWPTFKAVDRELDRVGIDAESTLSPLAPAWVLFATNSPDSSDVKLTFAGAAQVADAGTLVDAAARVAGWIADSERESNQVAILATSLGSRHSKRSSLWASTRIPLAVPLSCSPPMGFHTTRTATRTSAACRK